MTIHLNIPKAWNDLSTRQLKKIAVLFYADLSGVIFDYKAFLILLNIRWWQVYKRYKAEKTIKNVGFSTLKETYNWLHATLSLTTFIPLLKYKKLALFAPADRITNLTINEFSHADDLYLGWYNTKNFEYLQYLTAVLYREKGANGKRLPFDKTELDERAKYFAKTNKKTLLAISLAYQGSRQYVVSQFPLVFPPTKPNAKTPNSSGFGKLVLHLSGKKFGTHNETKNTNVYTFFADFEEQLKQKPYES